MISPSGDTTGGADTARFATALAQSVSPVPDQMISLASVPTRDKIGRLMVWRDYDTALVGAWRLDLDGIGQLQVALDRAVEGIRAYQERQAAEDA